MDMIGKVRRMKLRVILPPHYRTRSIRNLALVPLFGCCAAARLEAV